MAIKATKKEIVHGFDCYEVAYCELQALLHYKTPTFYTCGVYGWHGKESPFKNNEVRKSGSTILFTIRGLQRLYNQKQDIPIKSKKKYSFPDIMTPKEASSVFSVTPALIRFYCKGTVINGITYPPKLKEYEYRKSGNILLVALPALRRILSTKCI